MSLPYALIARVPPAHGKSLAARPTASTKPLPGRTSNGARKVSRIGGAKAKPSTLQSDLDGSAAWTAGKSSLPFQVRRFEGRGGHEVVMLIERGIGPAFWPSVFLTVKFLKFGKAPNTCAKVLNSIGMANAWARARGRDLGTELRQGDFISLADAEAIADHLMLSVGAQADANERASRPAMSPRRTGGIERFRPNPTALRRNARVALSAESSARIGYFGQYAAWHLEQRLAIRGQDPAKVAALRETCGPVVARLRQRGGARRSQASPDEAPQGVKREVIDLVSAALRPGSPGNPFKPGFVQARNELLWHFYVATGARREEIQSLLLADVEWQEQSAQLNKSKTMLRKVRFGHVATDVFLHFIETHWIGLPMAAQARNLLFTAEDGEPLSLRAVNRVFETIRKRVPGVLHTLTPHSLRRAWNDNFSAVIDRVPPDKRMLREDEIKARARLMGWSDNSQMPLLYADRFLNEKASELGNRLATEIGKGLGSRTDD